MSRTRTPLQISYTGDPVQVDPAKINDEMYVPNIGQGGSLYPDDRPGEVAARLFHIAQGEGALVIPDGLYVDCYDTDDQEGGGFVLVAYPAASRRVGVTCGWCDVKNLARLGEDEREDNDTGVVKAALEFMASEINTALLIHSDSNK